LRKALIIIIIIIISARYVHRTNRRAIAMMFVHLSVWDWRAVWSHGALWSGFKFMVG